MARFFESQRHRLTLDFLALSWRGEWCAVAAYQIEAGSPSLDHPVVSGAEQTYNQEIFGWDRR
jgi:hypothetical protein